MQRTPSSAPHHFTTSNSTRYGYFNPSPPMGTKGQPLIIHPGCQTMLAGCYLGWGRPIWIIQVQDSLSFKKPHGSSNVCESLISMQEPSVIPELTLAVTAAATWVAQKVARTCVPPISATRLHTVWVRRKDNGELAASRLSSLSVCLQYTMCHAELGGCQCLKKKQITLSQWVILLFTRGTFLFWYTSNVNCS